MFPKEFICITSFNPHEITELNCIIMIPIFLVMAADTCIK